MMLSWSLLCPLLRGLQKFPSHLLRAASHSSTPFLRQAQCKLFFLFSRCQGVGWHWGINPLLGMLFKSERPVLNLTLTRLLLRIFLAALCCGWLVSERPGCFPSISTMKRHLQGAYETVSKMLSIENFMPWVGYVPSKYSSVENANLRKCVRVHKSPTKPHLSLS